MMRPILRKSNSRQNLTHSRADYSPERREEREEREEAREDEDRHAQRKETLGYRLDLEEPLPQPSRNTTLSISKPVIRIEREDGKHSNNEVEAIYRISAAFVLQIAIDDFNDGLGSLLQYTLYSALIRL
jgi:hypothetical protein